MAGWVITTWSYINVGMWPRYWRFKWEGSRSDGWSSGVFNQDQRCHLGSVRTS